MTSRIMLIIAGRTRINEPLTAENAPRVVRALKQYLPELVRREGAVAAAVEKDGVIHVVQARGKNHAKE